MLASRLLARTGATMAGLSIGFVACAQTAPAFTLAVVAASFGAAFAASSLIAGHVLIRIGLRAILVGALASQFAILRWALLTAALAELIAFPLVHVMPAVTESLNRDAADRLGSWWRASRSARSGRSWSSSD